MWGSFCAWCGATDVPLHPLPFADDDEFIPVCDDEVCTDAYRS